jgi:two-component system response regulator AtoC
MARILIVEDDTSLAELLAMHLEDSSHQPRVAPTLGDARSALAQTSFDSVLLDQQMPDGLGLELLREIRERESELPVIMITGIHDTALPIEAIKLGAYDFLRKPMDQAELDHVLASALRQRRSSGHATGAELPVERRQSPRIIGKSQAIIGVCKTLGRVAPTDAPVLLTGETGTGKEVVARAIHQHSGRTGPFVAVNCSAIVDSLLESELFGHEKGSFTGADQRKPGKFEIAAEGTLFLDEIGDMSPNLQAKLLRVLQEHAFERVGGTRTLHTSARVIAATNRDLGEEVARQRFRDDLYFRLNVITIHLLPLRERAEDLDLLVPHLLAVIQRKLHKPIARVSQSAWNLMRSYSWPGNIRELENVLTRAAILAHGDVLTPETLGIAAATPTAIPAVAQVPASAPELISLEELASRHVKAILEFTHWHKGKACEILGISRPALERRIARLSRATPPNT